MTTSDARKRLAESIDRLERTRTHSIDPQTGQFTRLDQETDMHDHRTDADALIDYAVETSREHPKRAARNVSLAQVHALLAIHDTLKVLAGKRGHGECCEPAPADLEWLDEPVPVPHPDEALAKVLHDADSNGHFSWEGTGLMARADYLRMARAAREHIEANQLYAYRTVATERDKAEADLARVTKERDQAWRFRDAALEARDKAHDRYVALRADVEEFQSDHRDWTVMRGLDDALARDDARAEDQS